MDIINSVIKGLNQAIEIEATGRDAHKKSITISPIESFLANDIKTIRKNNHLTQTTLAAILGVSEKTVEAWEAGTNKPSGPARRLLSILKSDEFFIKKYHIIE